MTGGEKPNAKNFQRVCTREFRNRELFPQQAQKSTSDSDAVMLPRRSGHRVFEGSVGDNAVIVPYLQQLTHYEAGILWMALDRDELAGDIQGLGWALLSPGEGDCAGRIVKDHVTMGLIELLQRDSLVVSLLLHCGKRRDCFLVPRPCGNVVFTCVLLYPSLLPLVYLLSVTMSSDLMETDLQESWPQTLFDPHQ